jgi:hypothetical protein
MSDHDLGDAGTCWGEMFDDRDGFAPKFLVVKNPEYDE